ncbi:MAG: hypothetical protein CMM85_14915 [Rhodothermaceae bacterium]|nr:hypothetical protein [Rhodothermaceae bacterium]
MSTLLPGSLGPASRRLRVVAWLAGAAVLAALGASAADGADPVARAHLIRYIGILVSAAMGVGVLHVLYPAAVAARLQLSNPGPERLLRYQLGRWLPLVALAAAPAAGIAGADPLQMAEGVLSVFAIGLYAFARTAALGPTARAWEREEAGRWYRAGYQKAIEQKTPYFRFQVPDAMVPGLLRTGEVFVVGAVLSIVGEAIGSGLATLVAPVALLLLAAALTVRLGPTFDRAFWTSHGVWADAFRQVEQVDGREPIRVDAVYWAPPSVRPAVWAGLVSLDRRLPLGRLAALGLGLGALVYLTGAHAAAAAALALTVLGLNGAISLTADDHMLPAEATRRFGGTVRWTVARFLMNVRWLPPLVAVLLLLVWLADLGWAAVGLWTAAYLLAAAASAVAVTSFARFRLRRAVA